MAQENDGVPRLRDVLGMPVPPAAVIRAADRTRKRIGRIHDATAPPVQLVMERTLGLVDTKALFAAVDLGLPDLLEGGPMTVDALAAGADAHDVDAVTRLLRFLVSRGFFTERRDGRFENNAASDVLRAAHPWGWRGWVEFFGSDWNGRIWDALPDRVRTGTPATELAFGHSFFDFINQQHPPAGEAFNAAMGAGSRIQALMLAERLDWAGVQQVCDVGGGNGSTLAVLLRCHPALRGTVFDLPELADDAHEVLTSAGVEDRCAFVGGSFFDAVPAGADRYLMLAIVHDWDDESCRVILSTVAAGLTGDARIVVVEKPLPQDRAPDLVKTTDLLMLVLGDGGRERTEVEYEALFRSAGLRIANRTTLPSLFVAYDLAR